MTNPTYVFVHGSGSNARGWSNLQREMGLRGHRTIAVDLPGRGAGFTAAYFDQDLATFVTQPSPIAGVTAAETIEHVVDVVRQVRRHGPVVLVGHSFGGLVVTGVANAVPDLLDHLVYIAAQCPVNRSAGEYLTLPEWSTSALLSATAAIIVADPAELGVIRLNWLGADAARRTALREAIGAELTDDEFVQVIAGSQPDEVFWQFDPEWDHRAEAATWGRIPRTFVRTTLDRAVPPAAQDLYIAEADALTPDNLFEVHSVRSSHAGFFWRPHEVVEILSRLSAMVGSRPSQPARPGGS